MPTRQRAKICIVTAELVLLFRNGGIGTAASGLAQLLSKNGHEVTVLYTGERQKVDAEADRAAVEFYAREFDVRVVALADSPAIGPEAPRFAARALAVHHQLREGGFDAIFFNDVGAEGFYAVMAKRTRLAYDHTALCVVTHGPRTWVRELNSWPIADRDELENVFMEREAVRHADHAISPSRYMLDWLASDGWILPASTRVIPCRLPRWRRDPDSGPAARVPTRELVYFGRLEYRKGITAFCDMLDLLAPERPELQVTFLGKFGDVLGEHGGGYVLRRALAWPFALRFLPRLEQKSALDYLRARPHALAVIPSRVDNLPCVVAECLHEGIAFIASDSGGISELVAEPDRTRCLCAPDGASLAATVGTSFDTPPLPATPADSEEAIDRMWLAALEQILADRNARPNVRSGRREAGADVVVLGSADHAKEPTLQSIRDQGSLVGETRVATPGKAMRDACSRGTGEYMLIVDDGVTLARDALERLLSVAAETGADLVTCFIRGEDDTLLNLALGDAREAGFCRNVFGSGLMLLRKSSEVTTHLLESEHFGHDLWSSSCAASFVDLEIVCVPEPLCRATHEVRGEASRRAHQRVRDIFATNGYRGCGLLFDLLVGHVEPRSRLPFIEFLGDIDHGVVLAELSSLPPESDEALLAMANHAARTGRRQTAAELSAVASGESRLALDGDGELSFVVVLGRSELRTAVLAPACAEAQSAHPFPLVRLDAETPALQVHPVLGHEITAKLTLALTQGLREVHTRVFLARPEAPPVEFRVALSRADETIAASTWTLVDGAGQEAELHLTLPPLDPGDHELVLSTRLTSERMSYAHARFAAIRLVFTDPMPLSTRAPRDRDG